MSRLRATLSNSPLDRSIQTQVAAAERALRSALQACMNVRNDDTYGRANVARVRRDLQRALGATQSVRRASPSFDMGDKDLHPTEPYERPEEVVVEPEEEAEEAEVVVVDAEDAS